MTVKAPAQLKWDPTIGLGTVIHLGALLIALSIAWNAFSTRLALIEQEHRQMGKQVRTIGNQTARIDAYMLSHYPDYLKMPRVELDDRAVPEDAPANASK